MTDTLTLRLATTDDAARVAEIHLSSRSTNTTSPQPPRRSTSHGRPD